MFIRQKLSATEDKWSFFVRNWGVEGFCGPGNEPIQERTIRVRLQHKTSGNVTVNPQIFPYAHDSGNKQKCSQNEWSFVQQDDGVLLTFDLSDASNKCGWVGDFNIDWKVSGDPGGALGGAALAEFEQPTKPPEPIRLLVEERGDPVLEAKLEKLSPSERQQLLEQLAALMKSGPTTTPKPPGHPLKNTVGKPSVHAANKGKNLKAVPNQETSEEQARVLKSRQLIETFLKEHGIQ